MPEITKDLSFRRILDSLKLTPKHRLVEFGGKIFVFGFCVTKLLILFFSLKIYGQKFFFGVL